MGKLVQGPLLTHNNSNSTKSKTNSSRTTPTLQAESLLVHIWTKIQQKRLRTQMNINNTTNRLRKLLYLDRLMFQVLCFYVFASTLLAGPPPCNNLCCMHCTTRRGFQMQSKTAPATKTTDSDGPKVDPPKRCLEAPAYPSSTSIHTQASPAQDPAARG